MAKTLKERLVEQAEKFEKTRRLKESLARVEEQIRLTGEANKLAKALKTGQPPR